MKDVIEEEFGYLWSGSDSGWVLVKMPGSPGGYSVVHKINRSVLIIESDLDHADVCTRMKQHNCEVLDDFPSGTVDVEPC